MSNYVRIIFNKRQNKIQFWRSRQPLLKEYKMTMLNYQRVMSIIASLPNYKRIDVGGMTIFARR